MTGKKNILQVEQHCREHGIRLTTRRRQVLNGLLNSEKALSAYELAEYCQKENEKRIPPMSVYRILEFLEGEHLVHKLKLANKYIACAHVVCDQTLYIPQFLICDECSRVEEFNVGESALSDIMLSIESSSFSLLDPQLEISCLCERCDSKVYKDT